MTLVQTGSRLHFGLLSLSAASPWANCEGQERVPARQFGGVGLMVDAPGISVVARRAGAWSATGPLADRALGHAQALVARLAPDASPLAIEITQAAPHHAGLGTGTQLALAVGRAVTLELGLPPMDGPGLAMLLGRGQRSSIGLHGFDQGGFLVEAGKGRSDGLAPLVGRYAFPSEWVVLLVLPGWAEGLHGAPERQAFQQLRDQGASARATDVLCRLALLGLLPALLTRDLEAFGEALYDFNRRVGEAFAPVQGGPYASPRLEEVVGFLREQGVAGVGQSSWGPTLFAITDPDTATRLAMRTRDRFGLSPAEVFVTRARDHGATVSG